MKLIFENFINRILQKSYPRLIGPYEKPAIRVLFSLVPLLQISLVTTVVFYLPSSKASELPIAVQIDKQTQIIKDSLESENCVQAIAHIDQLRQLTKNIPLPLLFNQGHCYYKLGSMEKAVQILEAYLANGKNVDSNYQQALLIYISAEQNLLQQKEKEQQQRLSIQFQQQQAKQRQQKKQATMRQLRDNIAQVNWPMIKIEPGCFYMGSLENEEEKPMHRVCLEKGYAIGQYEVTHQQWQAVMQNVTDGSQSTKSLLCKSKNCPITSISWQTIRIFIDKLNQLSNKRYRLPTEAEWEFACRSLGKNQRSCNGQRLNAIYGSYNNKLKMLKPVTQTSKNNLEVYGMNNNVNEWVQDYFSDIYYAGSPLNNPLGPKTGTTRVIRSGCCISYDNKTIINRLGREQIYFDEKLGFRLVNDL